MREKRNGGAAAAAAAASAGARASGALVSEPLADDEVALGTVLLHHRLLSSDGVRRADPPTSGRRPSNACEDARMDAAGLHAWCLRHPGAVEEFPFSPETSVFKVGGKIFALSPLDARRRSR